MTDAIETSSGLLLPDGRLIAPKIVTDTEGNQRLQSLLTRAEWERLNAMLRARFFLFRNEGGGYGERMICKARNPDGSWRGCGMKHMYITDNCVERPFKGGNGLEEGFFLAFRAATDEARQNQLLRVLSKLPDLAKGHPLTARDLMPKEPGENWLSVLISLPEPIKKEKAQHFAEQINIKRPQLKYCLFERCLNFLTPDPDCTVGKHEFAMG